MPGWDNWEAVFEEGFKQAREAGREEAAIAELEREVESVLSDDDKAGKLFEKLLKIPVRSDFQFEEPSDLEQIKARRIDNRPQFVAEWSDDELLDKIKNPRSKLRGI